MRGSDGFGLMIWSETSSIIDSFFVAIVLGFLVFRPLVSILDGRLRLDIDDASDVDLNLCLVLLDVVVRMDTLDRIDELVGIDGGSMVSSSSNLLKLMLAPDLLSL